MDQVSSPVVNRLPGQYLEHSAFRKNAETQRVPCREPSLVIS